MNQHESEPQAHACFRMELDYPIDLPGSLNVSRLWQALSYRIVRVPDDLLAHTRRVRLCAHPRLVHFLPGALVDLHRVLGTRGQALQRRLLHVSRTELDVLWFTRFDQALSGAGLPEPLMQSVHGSVLPSMAQLQQRLRPGAGTAGTAEKN